MTQATSRDQITSITMMDPKVIACPFPTYHRLQAERPVHRDPQTGYFEVTRYDDMRAIAQDAETFSNKFNRQNSRSQALQAEMQRLYDAAGFPPVPTLLNNDPPDHRAIRSLVDKAFLPARIGALQPAVAAEAARLVDAFIDRRQCEFMAEFAISLPVNIIADQLGVARDQRPVVRDGSDSLLAVADPMTPDDMMLHHTRRIIGMQTLIAERIDHARRKPDDTILSAVANDTEQRFDIPLLVHLFQSILVAGNETTTNALGNSMLMLVDDPALFAQVKADPSLVRAFVEESLRVKSPFQGFYRVATRDTELHGVAIPKDSLIVLRWGAGGHDHDQYECPEQIRLDRPNLTKHLTFGAGTHFCLGNLLARTEMRAAFAEITQRLDNVRLADAPDARTLAPTFFNQGVARIDLRFDRAA
ncbi:Cytochrome P450 [Sphingobium faniae]|nr:Cytochrome P450 [Sphingobium faniae]